ncbi:MAG: LexA family transcriptional regulator [Synechococcaceae cyanobacterium]|nr:LexA family transcriptional regulator [Synechococcaceae cyanobacterium]
MAIGERIKKVRGEALQEEFAKRISVSKMTVGRWERGERIPDQENLCKILQEYPHISPAWLLAGEGPERRDAVHVHEDGTTCHHPLHHLIRQPFPSAFDPELLVEAKQALDTAIASTGEPFSQDEQTKLLELVYADAYWRGKVVSDETIETLINAALLGREIIGKGPMKWGEGGELPEGYVQVPRYAIQAAAGGGALVNSEQIVDHLAFKADWLKQQLGLNPAQAAVISVIGDSMEPYLYEGDLILIDLGITTITNDAIYVLQVNGNLLVKRIQTKSDGTVIVKSDNQRYEPEVFRGEAVDLLRVVGRLVRRLVR